MPDYKFITGENKVPAAVGNQSGSEQAWPAVDAQTSLAGMLGGVGTLVIVVGLGFLLRPRRVHKLPHT
jgi:hypothetical protein